MFKFLSDVKEDTNYPSKQDERIVRSAEEINLTDLNYQISKEVPFTGYNVENENVKNILQSTSDLNCGVYEGGFKIWECTYDLIQYIQDNPDAEFINKSSRVLDCGCGSGLLGLYALWKGADAVHFQDYNSEVLNFLTVPNVIINFDDETVAKSRFFGGDWGSLQELMENSHDADTNFKYDLILSSETIYNFENLPRFFNLIKSRLKPNGKLLLAAKTCYFGVGGGTKEFQRVMDEDLSMDWKVVKAIREGVQREIILVQFKL